VLFSSCLAARSDLLYFVTMSSDAPYLTISEPSQAFDPILYILYKQAVYDSLSTGIVSGEGQEICCYLSNF
jgi:hypothetical protein